MNSLEQLVIQRLFIVVVILVNSNLPIRFSFFFLSEKSFINILNRITHLKNSEKHSTLKSRPLENAVCLLSFLNILLVYKLSV